MHRNLEHLDSILATAGPVLTIADVIIRKDDMQRRLNGRCKGLLEVTRGKQRGEYDLPILRVDFLHRTVHDFLLTKDVQTMLNENVKDDFNPNLRLCKALLAQLKFLSPGELGGFGWHGRELLEDLLFYVRVSKVTAPLSAFLDICEIFVTVPNAFKIPILPNLHPFKTLKKFKLYFARFEVDIGVTL